MPDQINIIDPDKASTWTVTATATNAAATATKAAVAGQKHYVTSISGSFGAAAIALMTFESPAATVLGNYHVHNQRDPRLTKPHEIATNTAVVLSLAAGGVGVVGAVTMTGYTI